jgi:homoserine kinase
MNEITVLSPATVANVVCGFDCLGFALEGPCDEMTLRRVERSGIHISHSDDFGLPVDPMKNVAGVALQAFIEAAELKHGFEIEITKKIRPGSGIGSSAASACGAVVAANHLLGGAFSKRDLVQFALAGEMVASGSRHADNLAPCIYGGFTLVRSSKPLDIIPLGTPDLFVTIIHPQIEVKTSEARSILPREVPLDKAVANWSNLGAFVAGLIKGDQELISRSMVDTIIEPARKALIPGFDEIKATSLATGALGAGISGSGPSIFALSADENTAREVEIVMRDIYSQADIIFQTYVSRVADSGVRLAESET